MPGASACRRICMCLRAIAAFSPPGFSAHPCAGNAVCCPSSVQALTASAQCASLRMLLLHWPGSMSHAALKSAATRTLPGAAAARPPPRRTPRPSADGTGCAQREHSAVLGRCAAPNLGACAPVYPMTGHQLRAPRPAHATPLRTCLVLWHSISRVCQIGPAAARPHASLCSPEVGCAPRPGRSPLLRPSVPLASPPPPLHPLVQRCNSTDNPALCFAIVRLIRRSTAIVWLGCGANPLAYSSSAELELFSQATIATTTQSSAGLILGTARMFNSTSVAWSDIKSKTDVVRLTGGLCLIRGWRLLGGLLGSRRSTSTH